MDRVSRYDERRQETEGLDLERQRRRALEQALLETRRRHERLVNTIPCTLYDYARWPDGRGRFLYLSPQCKAIFGYDAAQVIADSDLLWGMVHPDDLERLREEDRVANLARQRFQSEVRILPPAGGTKWIQLTSMPSAETIDSQPIWSGVILEITERKRAEEERNQLVSELQSALAQVKTLRGFLPICASCKKIRDDRGYWNQIEAYISSHSEAEFSHGICPDCAEGLYPELGSSGVC